MRKTLLTSAAILSATGGLAVVQTAAHTIVPASGGPSNAAGYKLNPIGVAFYIRLYPGIGGLATNGLRNGAAVEIRENFEGGNSLAVSSAPTTVAGSTSITTNLDPTRGTSSLTLRRRLPIRSILATRPARTAST